MSKMFSYMLPIQFKGQVCGRVIQFITIPMMDNLTALKWAAKQLFHHYLMFITPPVLNMRSSISIIDSGAALPSMVQFTRGAQESLTRTTKRTKLCAFSFVSFDATNRAIELYLFMFHTIHYTISWAISLGGGIVRAGAGAALGILTRPR